MPHQLKFASALHIKFTKKQENHEQNVNKRFGPDEWPRLGWLTLHEKLFQRPVDTLEVV
jgi:hypothetical protein